MTGVARGDLAAFDELYRRYAASVLHFAARLVSDRQSAEDIAQETFLAAWRGAARFRGECSVKTWLLRMAHHQAVSWWRKQRPQESLDADPERYEQVPDPAQGLTWPNEALQAEIERLTPTHRAVVYLTFAQDCSQAEIAALMGCSVGTVKSRLHYALRAMRLALLPRQQ